MKPHAELERVDAHGLSIQGDRHTTNHDRFAVADLAKSLRLQYTNLPPDDASPVRRLPQGHVYLVADGVSGRPAPATASSTAVRTIVDAFLHDLPWTELLDGHHEDVLATLEDALRNAQKELQNAHWIGSQGMATTLTLAFVRWPDLFLAHVGDSRAYLLRRGDVRRLTRVHTLAEVKRALGHEVRPEDEQRLWNTVGGPSSQLDPQVEHHRLHAGDTLVLMTDGVPAAHSEETLRAALRASGNAEDLCGHLVAVPGHDDRTAVVARFLAESGVDVERAEPRGPRRLTARRSLPFPQEKTGRRAAPGQGPRRLRRAR